MFVIRVGEASGAPESGLIASVLRCRSQSLYLVLPKVLT